MGVLLLDASYVNDGSVEYDGGKLAIFNGKLQKLTGLDAGLGKRQAKRKLRGVKVTPSREVEELIFYSSEIGDDSDDVVLTDPSGNVIRVRSEMAIGK